MPKVNLETLEFGTRSLPIDQLTSEHRQVVDAFFNSPQVTSFLRVWAKDSGTFTYRIHPDRITLLAGGKSRRIGFEPGERIQQVFQFWRRVLPSPETLRQIQKAPKRAERGKAEMALDNRPEDWPELAQERPCKRKLMAGVKQANPFVSVGESAMSIARNGASIDLPGDHAFLSGSGIVVGAIWAITSWFQGKVAGREISRAQEVGDEEGVRRGKMRLFSTTIVFSASTMYTSQKFFSFVGWNVLVGGAWLATLVTVIFAVGSLIAIAAASINLYRCLTFRDRLNEYLECETLTPKERLEGAVQFLTEQVSLTPEERRAIEKEVEKKCSDPTQRKGELEKALADHTEAKMRKFKRRTSQASLDRVLECIEKEETHNPVARRAQMESLVTQVLKENRGKSALFALAIVAGVLGFVATVIGTVLTFGTLPLILSIIAGVIYLLLALYTLYSQWVQKKMVGDQGAVGVAPFYAAHHS